MTRNTPWILVIITLLAIPSTASADSWKDVERAARALERKAERAARKAPLRTEPEKVVKTIRGRKNPRNIYAWVVENIGYEPYVGSLRGASGTLAAGAGNSVDIAILTSGLYEAAGFETRFVRGRVYDREQRELIAEFAGGATLIVPSQVSGKSKIEKEKAWDQQRYLGLARDHMWVEVLDDGKWQAADPVLGDGWGIAEGEVLQRTDEVPDSMFAALQVDLYSRLEDGQERTLLTVKAPLGKFANRSVSLVFEPAAGRKNAVKPVLSAGATRERGDTIKIDPLALLQLRFTLRRGRFESRWNETLFRADGTGRNVFDYDQQYYSIAVLPGWVDDAFVRAKAAEAMEEMHDAIRDGRKNEAFDGPRKERALNAVYRPLPYLISIALAAHNDRLARELARSLGVEPIIYDPRIITTGVLRDGDDFSLEVAVKGASFEAVPKDGIPAAAASGFLTLQGRVENQLEGAVLSKIAGEDVFTVDNYFERAMKDKVPVTTIDLRRVRRLEEMDLADEVRDAMDELVRKKGAILLTTTKPVSRGEASYVGWWSLDPTTGKIDGALGDSLVAAGTDADERPATEDAGSIVGAAVTLADSLYDVTAGAAAESTEYHAVVCEARSDVMTLARAFCAKKRAIDLPELNACLQPKDERADDELVGVRRSCRQRTHPTRCGAVVADAFLSGELTALYTGEKQDFEKGGDKKLRKSDTSGKATGITCR